MSKSPYGRGKQTERNAGHCVCNSKILARFVHLYRELLIHDGYGEIGLEIKILKRGQKEVIIHCGKEYRYVVDFDPGKTPKELEDFSAYIEKHIESASGDKGSQG